MVHSKLYRLSAIAISSIPMTGQASYPPKNLAIPLSQDNRIAGGNVAGNFFARVTTYGQRHARSAEFISVSGRSSMRTPMNSPLAGGSRTVVGFPSQVVSFE
ncbi:MULTISPECIES: hypothetical protein [Pandoraea]|uniref:Uncharacterized protein n=2 Tax=Pandoraea TaxID=93217 RepID=A0A5E4Z514_9BURK|nr:MULTISPECIES: hypothetical protein [Pandoraea]MCE4061668.1 hypothetical protein [Pandoraea sputorum]UVA78995.1 hypothetical protein NTU39_23720 [Pandoraea commovens]VVE03244.1 hypothetical protein PAQ31011_02246 [Pandoraea aquatica]VVE55273.1 hypothetical protein PCO31010_04993 [Pandoraea commovens]